MSGEQARLLKDVAAVRDRVDLLRLLLAVCRTHRDQLRTMNGDREQRSVATARTREARAHFASALVNRSARDYLHQQLSADDYPQAARIVAVAIDQVVRSQDPRKYRTMCAKYGLRILEDLDPIPTPVFPVTETFGKGGLSTPPRESPWAVDRVVGLALWDSSAHGSLQVIYDPIAGEALNNALHSEIEALTVTPNRSLAAEFTPGSSTPTGFFGIHVIDVEKQNAAFRASLRYCSEHEIDILVLPELAGTEDFPAILTQSTDSHPRVVIAGSRHMTDDGLHVNRQTVWYRHTNHLVCHDKSGRFFVGAPVVESDGVSEPNSAAMEDIDYGQTIRLHAGTDWSMAPLVCADFLDENVVRAVADLHPRLVVVSAMSPKTSPFELSSATVIAACQATVIVANGPLDLRSAAHAQTSPLTDADCATVAIFALPLSDPGQATIRVRPTASTSAPHLVHFRSARRTAELLSGIHI